MSKIKAHLYFFADMLYSLEVVRNDINKCTCMLTHVLHYYAEKKKKKYEMSIL